MNSLSASRQSEIKAWEEEIVSCDHIRNLQQDAAKIVFAGMRTNTMLHTLSLFRSSQIERRQRILTEFPISRQKMPIVPIVSWERTYGSALSAAIWDADVNSTVVQEE